MHSLSMTKQEYKKKADEYVQESKRAALDAWRLHYHIMPMTGWLNDPNGCCQFHGLYHIYYQYSPFDVEGKTKLWGHVTSKDLVHFQEEEPFLYPDHAQDIRGVYSGSAWVKKDTIYFYYTGNVKLLDQEYDYIHEGREQNTMLVTSKDGYESSEKQCLLQNHDYPEDMSCHVRDPKLYEHEGHTYMVLGARDQRDQGCALVYETDDLKHFSHVGTLTTKEAFGYMWECPDLFDLDEQTILIVCPQGVQKEEWKYQNVHQCGYFKLSSAVSSSMPLQDFHMLDYGFDFYAPQSFQDEQGRRILIGWMGLPDIPYDNPTKAHGWQHALTMPRELSWRNGLLCQTPLKEYEALRGDPIQCSLEDLGDHCILDRVYECCIEVQNPGFFTLVLRNETTLSYDLHTGFLSLQLGTEGYGRTLRKAAVASLTRIRIFSDTSSLEIFVNDGEAVFTTRAYEETAHKVLQAQDCQMSGNVVWYPLKRTTR